MNYLADRAVLKEKVLAATQKPDRQQDRHSLDWSIGNIMYGLVYQY